MERRPSLSPSGRKTNNSPAYPAFSKAHSKEAVGSKEEISNHRFSYQTPEPTDLAQTDKHVDSGKVVAPPSPPETTVEQKVELEKPKVETIKSDRKKTDLQKSAEEVKRRLGRDSQVGKRKHSHSSRTRSGAQELSRDESHRSASSTPSKLSRPRAATVEDAESSTSLQKRPPSSVQSSQSEGTTDSDATSIAPNQTSIQRPFTPQLNNNRDSSPATETDSPGPKTPTLSEAQMPSSRKEAQTPAFSIAESHTPSIMVEESPMPPPPPPAPSEMPVPRVDYLLQNGGLNHAVHRSLLAAGHSIPPLEQMPAAKTQADSFFAPFNRVLEDYSKVIARRGSLAVATGYRSVARRLLDRLEAVFARDISSEHCLCEMCQHSTQLEQEPLDKRGISWGEILEYVCGRQELPQWPVFVLDNAGLGISPTEHVPPMQKLDIDVPDEFREHYVRQSKRTKQAVDKWLESQPTNPVSPPNDVDDETLTFAMMTRLDAEQRPLFSSILGVSTSNRPVSACSTKPSSEPIMPPTSELLQKTGLAIQRLYRLAKAPRDPESAMYLLNNPSIHTVLATLAAISDGEWGILISGRFDGFLRSGAEDEVPTPTVNNPLPFGRSASRNIPSRPATANSMHMFPNNQTLSRGPTPSPAIGAPVALDEETEIAALAEIEREIYLGMEALEDAFEALHLKAEGVRNALRERSAGLAQANQDRLRAQTGSCALDSRLGTPASVWGGPGHGWDSETDDGFDDGASELAPDDSASNFSRSRVRRPKRRTERRTPAPVEEEDEGEGH